MQRILVVEDDGQLRTLLRRLFERAGYTVAEACDGEQGLRMQRQEPCDLIVTDLVMPGKDGIAMIREIRKEMPGTKIIAISGGGRVDAGRYLRIAETLGAVRSFTKPFKLQEMEAAVRQVLAS